MEYNANLDDHNGDIIRPYTNVAGILDLFAKVVTQYGDQTSIKGKKDFNDGLYVAGKKVLTEDYTTSTIPNNDVYQIARSGVYYYKDDTKNVPFFNHSENGTGYILATFKDDTDFGILFFIGSLTVMEKWQGSWRSAFSPQAVTLWSGNAKPGDKLTLLDSAGNYSTLNFYLNTSNGPVMISAQQAGRSDTDYYLDSPALTYGSNQTYRFDESHLIISSDKNSFTFADRVINVGGTSSSNKDASLTKIEGVRS